MKKLLVVVDMQNDFINGALGTPEADAICPKVAEKAYNWDGDLVYTLDTHGENYMDTNEGRHLPVPHCIEGTAGHQLNPHIEAALWSHGEPRCFKKNTFGSVELAQFIQDQGYEYVEFIGLCTDICVASNAILTKAFVPEIQIAVDASCCAGVTPQSHEAALTTMGMCQIDVIGR